jgi:hypothetical protein
MCKIVKLLQRKYVIFDIYQNINIMIDSFNDNDKRVKAKKIFFIFY